MQGILFPFLSFLPLHLVGTYCDDDADKSKASSQ